jgi:hypothetical protein
LCCFSTLYGSLALPQRRLISHTVSAASEPSVSLRGEAAASWLKQDDAHNSLRASIASLLFSEDKRITGSRGSPGALFGATVAISGDTAVVGMPNDGSELPVQGAAFIFERNLGGADNWGELKRLTASDADSGDNFGTSVAIDGDTIVVGARGHDVGENLAQGAAYVFERNRGGQNNWGEVKKIISSDGQQESLFGISAAISGDTVVVGALFQDIGDNVSQGAAYVFERDRGGEDNWGEVKKLVGSNGGPVDRFGERVAISLDTIVVGAIFANGEIIRQGAAYVFERDRGGEDNWGETKKLTASDGQDTGVFGISVSISVDTVVVGASNHAVGENEEQGVAYVFERDRGGEDNWGETKKLTASDGVTRDRLGLSAAINGDFIVVGAPKKDFGDSNSQGAAYVFERNRGGEDNWGEVNRLTASDGAEEDEFGEAVAIGLDTVIVGAHQKEIADIFNEGAAYVFTPSSAPVIIPATIHVQQPSFIEATIATVSDDTTPAGELIVEVVAAPAGSFVSSIGNDGGSISALISVTCSAAAGDNFVELKVTDSDGESSTANLIINVTAENEPPTIQCPSDIIAVAARPGIASVVINYNQPQVSDNCTVASVTCNPPSGSAFPAGITTVTCIATDTAGNAAQCSFTVTVFDACLQDDSSPNRAMFFNTFTGDYLFCLNGVRYSGRGSLTRMGNTFTLVHNASDRRVKATLDATQDKGTASIKSPPGGTAITITDRDIRTNTCSCATI